MGIRNAGRIDGDARFVCLRYRHRWPQQLDQPDGKPASLLDADHADDAGSRWGLHDAEGQEFLKTLSPLFMVDKIKRPLLIGQGAKDPRVKQHESDQIVAAMKEKNIPVTYLFTRKKAMDLTGRKTTSPSLPLPKRFWLSNWAGITNRSAMISRAPTWKFRPDPKGAGTFRSTETVAEVSKA